MFFDSFFSGSDSVEINVSLKTLLARTKASGILRIDNAFSIPNRGTVLAGNFVGNVKPADLSEIVMSPETAQSDFTSVVLGLERFQKLEDLLNSPDEEIGCGILVKTHPDHDSLKGKYLLTYSR